MDEDLTSALGQMDEETLKSEQSKYSNQSSGAA